MVKFLYSFPSVHSKTFIPQHFLHLSLVSVPPPFQSQEVQVGKLPVCWLPVSQWRVQTGKHFHTKVDRLDVTHTKHALRTSPRALGNAGGINSHRGFTQGSLHPLESHRWLRVRRTHFQHMRVEGTRDGARHILPQSRPEPH